tara:strand:- start:16231 stop:16437 length:207 start_codon:yes stop_codon:yes gene_type:complete
MGRAIDQDNRLDDHDRRLKLLEDAVEGLIQTTVTHRDLEASNNKVDKDTVVTKTKRKIKKDTRSVAST